jgi:sigma-E factor negative regulatory protein RseA
MSDLLHEQLSALIDGELPVAETTLLLKRLEREPELRARLARYRACGVTMRGGETRVRTDFTLRVTTLLAAEPAHAASAGESFRAPRPTAGARGTLPRYLKPLAGLGVAAAVATAAILVLGRPGPATAPAEVAVVVATPAPLDGDGATIVTPAVARRAELPASYPLQSPIGAEPASYVTPAVRQGLGVIPRAELANYVVIHAGVSGPMGLHSALTSLVSDDAGAATK